MPGPIATAFVDIVARLRLAEDFDLEKKIRSEVRAAERHFNRIENISETAANRIEAAFAKLQLRLDVRGAVQGLDRIQDAGQRAFSELQRLDNVEVDVNLDTGAMIADLGRVNALLTNLKRTIKEVDGEKITVDAARANAILGLMNDKMEELQSRITELQGEDVSIDTRSAQRAVDALAEAIRLVKAQIDRLEGDKVTVTFDEIGVVQLDRSLRRIQTQLQQVESAGRQAERATRGISNIGPDFSRVFARIVGIQIFETAAEGLFRMVVAGAAATAELERTRTALDQLIDAMPELNTTTEEFFSRVQRLALTTPFEFKDLAQLSQRLITLGGDADLALERLQILADAGAVAGATEADIAGVGRAITQLAAKGRVDLQDLRQISERLPIFTRQRQLQGIIDEFNEFQATAGNSLRATRDNFNDLREDGLIPTEIIISGLFRGLREIPGALGASLRQSRTLLGAISNLADLATRTFDQAFRNVGGIIADQLNSAIQSSLDDVDPTPLQEAIELVINAVGSAVEQGLPAGFKFVEEMADEIADLITTAGELVEEFLSGFGGAAVQGAVSGLTDILGVLRLMNGLLSLLPEGVSKIAGELVTLAVLVPGAMTPFKNLLQDVAYVIAGQISPGLITMRKGFKDLSTSLGPAAGAAAGLLVIQLVGNHMETAARRAREFDQAISNAADSMREFAREGDPALEFLEDLTDVGAGVDLGNLEQQFDGLTSIDIAGGLGVDLQELGTIMENLARSGAAADLEQLGEDLRFAFEDPGGFAGEGAQERFENAAAGVDAFREALIEAGVAEGIVNSLTADMLINLATLGNQWGIAAEQAVRAGLASGQFTHTTGRGLSTIIATAEATGDWQTALDRLNFGELRGSEGDFLRLAASSGLADSEIRAMLRDVPDLEDGTEDWTTAVAVLTTRIGELSDEMTDLLDQFPGVASAFVGIQDGTGDAASDLLDFALAVDAAGLEVDQLQALAIGLGSSLSGEELGEALGQIAEDFKETLDVVLESLPSFGDAFGNVLDEIAIPEDTPEGFDELQFRLDHFTVDNFIEELGKIATARAALLTNLTELAVISPEAVERLLGLDLDPAELALAAQGLVEGGLGKVEEFMAIFQWDDAVVGGVGRDLIETLVKSGIDPALFEAIPGLAAALGLTVTEAAATVDLAPAVQTLNDAILREFGDVNLLPESVMDEAELRRLIAARDAAVGAGPAPAIPDIPLPEIDIEEATTDAAEAGGLVSGAFLTSFDREFKLAPVTEAKFKENSQVVSLRGGELQGLASNLGTRMTKNFDKGLYFDQILGGELMAMSSRLIAGPENLPQLAFNLGWNMGHQLASAIRASVPAVIAAVVELGQKIERTVSPENFTFEFPVRPSGPTSEKIGEGNPFGSTHGPKPFSIPTPVIDIEEARADAEEAGAAVSGAFLESFKDDFALPEVAQVVVNATVFVLGEAAGRLGLAASELGSRATSNFDKGLYMNQILSSELTTMGGTLLTETPRLGAMAFTLGLSLGSQILAGLTVTRNTIEHILDDLIAKAITALNFVEIPTGPIPFNKFGQKQPPGGAHGFLATNPMVRLFAESGPEALVPLNDSGDAAKILAQLAPFIGPSGRREMADLFGLSGGASSGGQPPIGVVNVDARGLDRSQAEQLFRSTVDHRLTIRRDG